MANWVNDYLTRNPDRISKIHSRSRGSITFEISPGVYQTECSGNPIHYLDGGIWKPIDTTLIPIGTEYGTPWSKTRLKTDGSIRIIDALSASLHTQKTSQIGLFDPITRTFTPVVTSIPDGVVSGDSIIRAAGKFTHILRLKETGLREELRIESAGDVVGATKNWFVIETNFGITQLWHDGWIDTEFNKAGNVFPPPTATDANNEIIHLKRYAKYVSGVQYIYTGILISELSKYAFPLVIDPDYTAGASYGRIDGQSTVYATTRSTAAHVVTNDLTVGQMWIDPTYTVYRSFIKFDTSAIPDGDIITQVNMAMVCRADQSATDFDVQIVKQDWSVQDPLAAGNMEAAYDGCLAADADDSIWRNTSGMDIETVYISGNLNTARVNKIGSTYYGLRSSLDDSNTAPDSIDRIYFAQPDHATEAWRPILTVLHSGGAATDRMFLMF